MAARLKLGDNEPFISEVTMGLGGISLFGGGSTRQVDSAQPAGVPEVVWPAAVTLDPLDPKKQARTDYTAALLSTLVYEDEATIRSTLSKWGFTDVTVYGLKDPKAKTQAFVARKGDVVVVSFRGTKGKADVMTDLEATNKEDDPKLTGSEVQDYKRFAGAEVHRGFRDGRDEIWDPDSGGANGARLKKEDLPTLLSTLQAEAAKPKTKFVFTGHSLGAAETTLAAAATSVQNPANSSRTTMAGQIAAVVTFGSPKVGDSTFAAKYDALLGQVTRPYQHNTDIVRGLPKGLDFVHVVKDQTVEIEPADTANPPSALDSHRMGFYVDRLKARAEAEERANGTAASVSRSAVDSFEPGRG